MALCRICLVALLFFVAEAIQIVINPDASLMAEEATMRASAKGSTVTLILGGTKTCSKDSTLYRPDWNKQTRCEMVGGAEVCEQCFGTVDCFHGEGGTCDGSKDKSFLKVVSNSGRYTRFISRVTVCSGGKKKVELKSPEGWSISKGDLKTYFDGELICENGKECVKDFGTLAKREGGYELVTEFRPHEKGASASTQKEFFLEFDDEDLPCQASSCSEVLATDAILRNFNSKRLQCLLTGKGSPMCTAWRTCLKADGIARSTDLLLAGQPQDGIAMSSKGGKGGGQCTQNAKSESPTCFDPSTQPFDCDDCYTEFRSTCDRKCKGLGFRRCIKAHACQMSSVCESWKKCNCGGAVATCRTRLEDLGSSLSQRAIQNRSRVSAHVANNDGVRDSLDGMVQGKCSQ